MLPLLLALTIAAPTQLPAITAVPSTSSARLVVLDVVDGVGDDDGREFAARLSERMRADLAHHPQIALVTSSPTPSSPTPTPPTSPTPSTSLSVSWPCDDVCRAGAAAVHEARLVWVARSTRRAGAYVVELDLYDNVQLRSLGPTTVEAATIAELLGPLRLATDSLIQQALAPSTFPRVLFAAGVATTVVGVAAASVGVAGVLVNIERASSASSAAKAEQYEAWRDRFGVVAIAGGVAVVGGATMMMVDLLRERQDTQP